MKLNKGTTSVVVGLMLWAGWHVFWSLPPPARMGLILFMGWTFFFWGLLKITATPERQPPATRITDYKPKKGGGKKMGRVRYFGNQGGEWGQCKACGCEYMGALAVCPSCRTGAGYSRSSASDVYPNGTIIDIETGEPVNPESAKPKKKKKVDLYVKWPSRAKGAEDGEQGSEPTVSKV